jgi:hypothetical protein
MLTANRCVVATQACRPVLPEYVWLHYTVDLTWQHDLEVSLRLLAQDYDETAEDLEIGASEIRHPELLPEGKPPR